MSVLAADTALGVPPAPAPPVLQLVPAPADHEMPTGVVPPEASIRHAWYPISPCGDRCQQMPTRPAGMLVRAWRVARLATVIVAVAALGMPVMVMPRLIRRAFLRCAAHHLLAALGIRVDIDDRRPFGSRTRGLVVANHISYLDILAVAVIQPARFVAKSDVAAMPVVSALARRLGVICIDRGSLRTLPDAVGRARAGLESDSSVAVFPEGTTRCGRGMGTFAPAFFQAALDANVPVLPIGLAYRIDGIRTAAPGFIGDDEPLDTLGRVLRTRGISVHVRLYEPQLPAGDRGTLAARCAALVGSDAVAH